MTYQPVRTPRHEYIDIRGLKHRLTCWGDATDDPIVLLHGLQDCGDTWQFLVDCLPGEWSLVAPDWRGFGGSEWAPDAYWFPDYLADLEALLESLVPKARARVIAHSMGANITGLYCGIRPRRLRWFVNLEGVGLRRTQPTEAPARYARWLDELKKPLHDRRYASIQQLADLLIARNARLRPDRAQFIARAWTRDVEPAPAVRLAFDPKHRLVNPVLYRLEEAEACWAHIEIPMLLLAGEVSGHQERLQTHFGEGRLDDLLRNARNVTLPGLGHMMHHEDPQAVAAEIVPFVQAQS
jgi:pimeloyl-ACP methyl ester carboxylesterase